MRVGAKPLRLELEPNGRLDLAQAFGPPVVLNSRLEGASDIDVIRFQIRAGKGRIFEGSEARYGRSSGAPIVVVGSESRASRYGEDRAIWAPFFSCRFEPDG